MPQLCRKKDEILDSAKETTGEEMVSDFNLPAEQFESVWFSGSALKDQILKLADTLENDLIVISSRRPICPPSASVQRRSGCTLRPYLSFWLST